MLEVEVKIRTHINEIRDKLVSIGFVRECSEYELDTYYNSELLDLKNEDKALRIRENRNLDSGKTVYILNYKGPKLDDSTMTRSETEFVIPSYEAGENLLTGIGYNPAGRVEKTRISYKKDGCTCCLDQVTGLGEFLEIEIMADESEYDIALGKINELLVKLGLSMNDTIRTSYLCMLQEMR